MNFKRLGVAVCRKSATVPGVVLVRLPDGEVFPVRGTVAARTLVAAWQHRRTPKGGAALLAIEWEGFTFRELPGDFT
jgi:hypothetical protein